MCSKNLEFVSILRAKNKFSQDKCYTEVITAFLMKLKGNQQHSFWGLMSLSRNHVGPEEIVSSPLTYCAIYFCKSKYNG